MKLKLLIFVLILISTVDAQIVQEFKKFRDTTYVNNQAAQSDTNTAHRNYMQANKDSITALRNDISLINISERVDGFYSDNILASSETFMNRGLGRMGGNYLVMRDCKLSRLFFSLSPDAKILSGSITIELYKNGSYNNVSLTLTSDNSYTKNDYPSITLRENDYVQLKITASSDLTPSNVIDVYGGFELNNFSTPAQDSVLIYAIAVDSGQVIMKDMSGNILSNPTYAIKGDTIRLIASKTYSGSYYSFTCWTGTEILDSGYYSGGTWYPSSRYNDTCLIIADENKTVRARFQKLPESRRILFVSNVEDSTISMPLYFSYGYELANGIESYDEVALTASDWKRIFHYADLQGCDMIVTNIYDVEGAEELAQTYYPTQLFMPSSPYGTSEKVYDSKGDLPSIILVGMTDTACYERTWLGNDYACLSQNGNNKIGYDAEFVTMPFESIYGEPIRNTVLGTVAYFAGLYLGNLDYNFAQSQSGISGLTPFKDYYGSRRLMRYDCDFMNNGERTWTEQNGYGYIDHTCITESDYATWLYNYYRTNPYYFRNLDPYLKR